MVCVPSALQILDPSVHNPILEQSIFWALAQLIDMPWMIHGCTISMNGCVPNHTWLTSRPTNPTLSAQEISHTSVHYPILEQPFTRALAQLKVRYVMNVSKRNCTSKWLRPNHIWCISRPTGSVLSTQEIFDPSIHHPRLDQPCIRAPPNSESNMQWMIIKATVPVNGCVPITNGAFQDPRGLSYPHKKYLTHPSNIQY